MLRVTAPPHARAEYGAPEAGAATDSPRFFAVSVPKLAVLSVLTGGLYQLYWFYRNWDLVRRRGEHIWPVPRAIFGAVTAYSLFQRIQEDPDTGTQPNWSPGLLALAFLALCVVARLPDPWWLLTFFSVLPLLRVQQSVNLLNASVAPDAPRNDTYSRGNIVVMVIGGLILLLALWGMLYSSS